jgi:hypothetical protein
MAYQYSNENNIEARSSRIALRASPAARKQHQRGVGAAKTENQ